MTFDKPIEQLELAEAQIASKYKNPYLILDPDKVDTRVKRFELSLPSLNYVLSSKYFGERAGFAMGKIYNFFGPESIGKTAMALQICSDLYKAGAKIAWIDKEHSFDTDYAYETYGLDIKNKSQLRVYKPDNAEEAFNIIQYLVDNNSIDVYVVDSISALGTEDQNNKDAEEKSMAELARKLSEHFPRIIGKIGRANISGIYINQLRANIVMGGAYGNKYTGGNAMRFYPHVGLEFKKPQGFEIYAGTGDTKEYIGHEVTIIGDKNKTAPPKKKANFIFYPGEGFSRVADVLNLATRCGLVHKSGAWYTVGEDRYQGFDNLRVALSTNEELLNKLWEDTKKVLQPEVNTQTGEILDVPSTTEQPAADLPQESAVEKPKRKKAS